MAIDQSNWNSAGNVCELCFQFIKPGDHYVDSDGQVWSVHPECEERDARAQIERKKKRG
jgi:hypothetical protein